MTLEKLLNLSKHGKMHAKINKKGFDFKSFHIEQVITKYFQENKSLEIFDAIFKFFINLSNIIQVPEIKDRADSNRYIDEYLNNLDHEQKKKIIQAGDGFLIKLELLTENDSIEELIKPYFYERIGNSEKFLFDHHIPILTENTKFVIDGFIEKKDGFRDGWISRVDGKIAKNRKISFQIKQDIPKDYTMWKVQNDKTSDEVLDENCTRGEITKNKTLRKSRKDCI